MLDTVRLYFKATVAVAIMAVFAIISGFASAGLTGDRRLAFLVAAVAFVLTGIVLTPVAHDQNTDPSPGAAHLTRRASPAAPRERIPA